LPQPVNLPPGASRSGWVQQSTGTNRRWRGQFCYRGSRRGSAVAPLFSSGGSASLTRKHNLMKTDNMLKMKKIEGTIIIVILALNVATSALAAGPVFYNTGVDDNHQQLSGGSLDHHYQMRQVSVGAYTGNPNWTNAVAMDTAITWSSWNKPTDARWIYVADAANLGQDWGNYELMTTFDLTGYDPTTAVLSGQWALDQYGTIYLNGNLAASLPDQNWDNNLTPFSLTSGFQSGTNLLTFYVRFPDGGDGMVVSGASLTASPLPQLSITANTQQFTVAWLASATNYVLESTTDLSTQNWVTNVGAINNGGTNYFYGKTTVGNLFFRLVKP
jgi:hypothetical protein